MTSFVYFGDVDKDILLNKCADLLCDNNGNEQGCPCHACVSVKTHPKVFTLPENNIATLRGVLEVAQEVEGSVLLVEDLAAFNVQMLDALLIPLESWLSIVARASQPSKIPASLKSRVFQVHVRPDDNQFPDIAKQILASLLAPGPNSSWVLPVYKADSDDVRGLMGSVEYYFRAELINREKDKGAKPFKSFSTESLLVAARVLANFQKIVDNSIVVNLKPMAYHSVQLAKDALLRGLD